MKFTSFISIVLFKTKYYQFQTKFKITLLKSTYLAINNRYYSSSVTSISSLPAVEVSVVSKLSSSLLSELDL